MAISLGGLDQPFPSHDVLQQLVVGYGAERDARVQQIIDMGFGRDHISFVTRRDCATCHGDGYHIECSGFDKHAATMAVSLVSCPTCPGLCVDGHPYVVTRT